MDDTGKRILICTHCEYADLSQSRAPCRAHPDGKYIGDLAAEDACPLKLHPAEGIARLAHGAAGLAKARLGIDAAPMSVRNRRLAICRACQHVKGDADACDICGCRLKAKTAIAHERCPIGRWTKTGKTVAFVQPARAGDILGILPAMRRTAIGGQKVLHLVCREFLPLVDGLSYLTPVPFDGSHDGVARAAALAAPLADELLLTQRWGNPQSLRDINFLVEPWVRAGMADRFDIEPLILDNRDADRERAYLDRIIGDDSRPVLLVNTSGHSSPYPGGASLVLWLRERWGERCRIIDLSYLPSWTERLQDLLGLYERASVLVSIDTGTLHLSYASRTPAVGLVNEKPTQDSPRRPHWIERVTYTESRTDAGRERIAVAIDAQLALARSLPHILHVVDDTWRPDPLSDDFRRLARAAETWAGIPGWTTARFRNPPRTSCGIGDPRNLPYVRDLLDWACRLSRADDLIVFTNGDSKLVDGAAQTIRRFMVGRDCAYGRRVDVPDDGVRTAAELATARSFDGIDLFAFTADWWHGVRDAWPDMLFGAEGWDACLALLVQRHSPGCTLPGIVYHRTHQTFWCDERNLKTNPAQVHNRRTARRWAQAEGFGEHLQPAGSDFLFHRFGDRP